MSDSYNIFSCSETVKDVRLKPIMDVARIVGKDMKRKIRDVFISTNLGNNCPTSFTVQLTYWLYTSNDIDAIGTAIRKKIFNEFNKRYKREGSITRISGMNVYWEDVTIVIVMLRSNYNPFYFNALLRTDSSEFDLAYLECIRPDVKKVKDYLQVPMYIPSNLSNVKTPTVFIESKCIANPMETQQSIISNTGVWIGIHNGRKYVSYTNDDKLSIYLMDRNRIAEYELPYIKI